MASMRVVAIMLDGTKHEAVGVYMALSDRVAFERHYDLSLMALRKEARESQTGEGDPATFREEQTGYFCWRLLTRAECPVGGFEDFLEGVEEVTLEALEGPADPMVPAPLPGPLPS
jgi:hypothetical protein